VLPLVLIHGHGGDFTDWDGLIARYGTGRRVLRIYAADADTLLPGDLPMSCVIDCDYYRDSATSPLFDADSSGYGHGSIGGCPVPRTDAAASNYTSFYLPRVTRIIEGVRRATGSDRVDLCVHSMGNTVGRAYIRWASLGARSGTSKVRRMLGIAGVNRGINALEAAVDGSSMPPNEQHFAMGENAEMCYEYPAWGGQSYTGLLNDGWDAFCAQNDVHYAGLTGTGAQGNLIDPNPPPNPQILGITFKGLGSPWNQVFTSISNLDPATLARILPELVIFLQDPLQEINEALEPSDGVVRWESSRMDEAPFLGRDFFAIFEGDHGAEWDPEQTVHTSTFTSELCRQYFSTTVVHSSSLVSATLKLVDSPGKASFLALETTANGPLVSAQVVEEMLDASGNQVGSSWGYGVPVPDGFQRAFLSVPRGGGTRRYRLVVYSPDAEVSVQDGIALTLTDGALEVAPVTTLVSVNSQTVVGGAAVTATFASTAPASATSLGYSFRLDNGPWTPWSSAATFTASLAPGEHRLDARSRHAANGAGLLCEDAAGTGVGLFVNATGALTVQR
jgi:pimeloyl-ACP methyl ester carboxylesterase